MIGRCVVLLSGPTVHSLTGLYQCFPSYLSYWKNIYVNICMGFLQQRNLLYRLQSGFRKRHSTETALIRLIDQLLLDLDKNRVTGLIFVDYIKAFDLIDHQVLLNKLHTYGIRGDELNLLQDYLSQPILVTVGSMLILMGSVLRQ